MRPLDGASVLRAASRDAGARQPLPARQRVEPSHGAARGRACISRRRPSTSCRRSAVATSPTCPSWTRSRRRAMSWRPPSMPIGRSCEVMLDTLRRPTASASGDDTDARARDAVRARLAESRGRVAAGDTPWTTVANAAYSSAPLPAMTVLVTLFNYRQYVARCVDSVVAATPPARGSRDRRRRRRLLGRRAPTWSSA